LDITDITEESLERVLQVLFDTDALQRNSTLNNNPPNKSRTGNQIASNRTSNVIDSGSDPEVIKSSISLHEASSPIVKKNLE
jgi:hypothetical protein